MLYRTGSAKIVLDKITQVGKLLQHASSGNYDEFCSINENFASTKLKDLQFFPVRIACYSPIR